MIRKKIVVAIDFNHDSKSLLKQASLIAKSIEAKISCVNVIDSIEFLSASYPNQKRKVELQLSQIVNESIGDENVPYEIIVTKGNFYERIIEIANEFSASLVLIHRKSTEHISKLSESLTIPLISISTNESVSLINLVVPINLESLYFLKIQKIIDIAALLKLRINILSYAIPKKPFNDSEYKYKLDEIKSLVEKADLSCKADFYKDVLNLENLINKLFVNSNSDVMVLTKEEHTLIMKADQHLGKLQNWPITLAHLPDFEISNNHSNEKAECY